MYKHEINKISLLDSQLGNRRRRIMCTDQVCCWELIAFHRPLSRQGLTQLSQHMTHVGWMAGPIATSAFNQLCQYASGPGTGPLLRRTRHFFPRGGLDHCQYLSLIHI